MFCEKCGKDIPDDAVICVGCGNTIKPISTVPKPDRSVKPASLGLLLGALIGSGVVAFIAFILIAVGAGSYNDGLVVLGVVLMILSVAGLIFGAVLLYIYIYRAWKIIQDGQCRATPREAVGLLFVPFYNIYWNFQAFWGWSKDYNSFIQRSSISAPRMPEGLFLTWAILGAASAVPYLGIITLIPLLIIAIIGAVNICKAINFFANRSE